MSTAADYPGKLIAFESIDTESTAVQVELLADWLQLEGYGVQVITPGMSKLAAKAFRAAADSRSLRNISYSILQAADLQEQTVHMIIPALRSGFMVLINPYLSTILAKNLARGHSLSWIENLYTGVPSADLTFYFRTSPDQAFNRITSAGPLNYHENGLDLAPEDTAKQAFMRYHSGVVSHLEALHDRWTFEIINLDQDTSCQQERVLAAVKGVLP